jgi:hypothetical protein
VRELDSDNWTETGLKMLSCGGNKNLWDFLHKYDLNEESVMQRYKSKAADYYRESVCK